MFILYAIPIGLIVGFLLGGRLSGLTNIRFRWGLLAVLGLLIQVVLFTDEVSSRIGDLGVPIYIGSTMLVLAAIVANLRLTGLPLVAGGAGLNLVAILANGGYMPASAEAYAEQGRTALDGYSNTKVVADPAFAWLTDVIPMPTWLPFHNVISLGDLLIGLGIVVAIAAGMRLRHPPADRPHEAPSAA